MPDVSRWMKYAKARLHAAIGQGHRDLDELEAQREAELADRPWLAAEGDAPTFDEARARIEWQAEQAARAAGNDDAAPASGGPSAPDGPDATPGGDAPRPTAPGLVPPEDRAAAAEAAAARLELDARERESAARLDAIREELGIEPPADAG